MKRFDPNFYGSFQKGTVYDSENPLEEVWSRVARFGNSSWVKSISAKAIPPIKTPWEEYGPYSIIRIRQAIEFRSAYQNTTTLTSPLPLYYSFLNMIRGFLGFKFQIKSSKSHGLSFKVKPNPLDCIAEITKKGTFPYFLKAFDFDDKVGLKISLKDCISRIVEIWKDYHSLQLGSSNVIPVEINTKMSGLFELKLYIPKSIKEHFNKDWKKLFPTLFDSCEIDPVTNTLKVKYDSEKLTAEIIEKYCNDKLLPSLIWREDPMWYLIIETNSSMMLPRSAYYFIAIFILGSIVRYEPELILKITDPDSELSWFIGRFIKTAERFFPQLMLNWIFLESVYF